MKLIHIATIVLITTTLYACGGSHDDHTKKTGKPKKDVSYITAPLQLLNPEYEISVPAELRPYEQVSIFAKVPGFVKKLYVDRGDHVHKGQLIGTLEAPEMDQQHLSDKSVEDKMHSDFIYAKQSYERLKEASATNGAVADIELDRAKSAMESAKSAYRSARAGSKHSAQLQDYLRITAPFDGIITSRNVSVGALAGTGAGQPIFSMAQGQMLRLTISLPEKHAASVSKGMSASFTVSSRPGEVFQASLSRTSGLLDQSDRSLTLEFDVDNQKGFLQGGDYALVKLKLKRKTPTFWVNSKSVVAAQNGTFVLAMQHDAIKRIPVKEGVRLDSLSEVFGKFDGGEQILLRPSEEIKEGKIK